MASLKENALTKVATVNLVDMKTAGSVALFTVPVGKSFIVDTIVIRNNSASLARAAGATSYGCTNWRSAVDLAGMTTTTGYRKLFTVDNTTYVPIAAGAVFYWIVTTGCDAACTATIDVFGHLV